MNTKIVTTIVGFVFALGIAAPAVSAVVLGFGTVTAVHHESYGAWSNDPLYYKMSSDPTRWHYTSNTPLAAAALLAVKAMGNANTLYYDDITLQTTTMVLNNPNPLANGVVENMIFLNGDFNGNYNGNSSYPWSYGHIAIGGDSGMVTSPDQVIVAASAMRDNKPVTARFLNGYIWNQSANTMLHVRLLMSIELQ